MTTKSRILVTGGTGQLGKIFLKETDNEYFQTDVLTRNKTLGSTKSIRYINADLIKAETLSSLGTDYDSIVHSASDPRNSDATDIIGTQNLLKRIKGNRIRNFMYISIVGVDKSNYKYYQDKLKAEELIIHSGIPYTILRVTQFHDFVYNRILNPANPKNDFITVPDGMKFQSIDLKDVCLEILRLLKNGATNSIKQIGGPEILKISDMVKAYQTIMMPEKKISLDPSQNDYQIFKTGINLCPDHKTGTITWRDFLLKKRKL